MNVASNSGTNALRASLAALDGVRRVLVDTENRAVGLVCEDGTDRIRLESAARDALAAADPDAADFQITVFHIDSARRRVRFLDLHRDEADDGTVEVSVTLEWKGTRYTGAASAPTRGGPVELRSGATATIRALEELIGDGLQLRLIGIKQIRAFDEQLVIASLRRPGSEPGRFVGSVVVSDDPLHASALAVLNAVNRMLGNFLAVSD